MQIQSTRHMHCRAVCDLQDLQQAACEVHTKLVQKSQDCIQQRRPLVRKPASRAADVKQYNPQFEEEYVAGKDYDPDRYLSAHQMVIVSVLCCAHAPSVPIVH